MVLHKNRIGFTNCFPFRPYEFGKTYKNAAAYPNWLFFLPIQSARNHGRPNPQTQPDLLHFLIFPLHCCSLPKYP